MSDRSPPGPPAESPAPAGRAARVAVVAALILFITAGVTGAAQPETRQAQAQLQEVRERIDRISRELADSLKARDRQGAELRQTELSVTSTRGQLEELGSQQKDLERRQQSLSAERNRVAGELERQRGALAAELRLAQRLQRNGPVQLLLTQDDPLRATRMLTYYGYFGRARAAQIDDIRRQGEALQAVDQRLQENEAALAVLLGERQQRLAQLEAQRQQRATTLAGLERESQDKSQALARLRSQQADLEKLLRQLSRSLRNAPAPVPSGAFASLRGRLNWPVAGSLLAQFGQERAQGVRWDGVLLGTERAADVHVVAAGRVVYADWLPGLGLLTIVDHGGGFLSLYGHNDALRRSAGENVAAGDVIASAGDTGGSSRPALYFEIRQGGKPINPAPWFARRRPD